MRVLKPNILVQKWLAPKQVGTTKIILIWIWFLGPLKFLVFREKKFTSSSIFRTSLYDLDDTSSCKTVLPVERKNQKQIYNQDFLTYQDIFYRMGCCEPCNGAQHQTESCLLALDSSAAFHTCGWKLRKIDWIEPWTNRCMLSVWPKEIAKIAIW